MKALVLLMVVTACAQDAAPCQGSVQLMKTYRQPIGNSPAGTTYRQGTLDNFDVCQEIADMYNANPSVQRAPARLLYFCSRGDQK